MLPEATAEFERACSLAGGSMYEASLAHAFGIAGRRAEALKVLEDLRKMAERRFVSRYDLAIGRVGLWSDKEQDNRGCNQVGDPVRRCALALRSSREWILVLTACVPIRDSGNCYG